MVAGGAGATSSINRITNTRGMQVVVAAEVFMQPDATGGTGGTGGGGGAGSGNPATMEQQEQLILVVVEVVDGYFSPTELTWRSWWFRNSNNKV